MRLGRVLVALLALVVVVAAADWLAGGRLWLRAEHALEARGVLPGKATTLRVPGLEPIPVFLHPEDRVITTAILTTGLWEPNETHWFVKTVRPGDVVVDAGANIGYYTIIASRLVGPAGRVYAFEPDPTAVAILRRNVRLNGADNVVVEQKALSNANTTLELFIAEGNKGDDRIYQPEGEQRASIRVPAVRLDDYLRGRADHVDVVKIDTQGAEGVILEGMGDIPRVNQQIVMFVEFWPAGLAGLGSDATVLLQHLRAADFRFYDLGAYGAVPVRLTEMDEAELLERHTLTNRWFTNLLCVKGFAHSRAQPAKDTVIPPNAPAPGRPAPARG
jgi:FkbM family methyltransferase